MKRIHMPFTTRRAGGVPEGGRGRPPSDQNESGFTVVELVAAMGIMMLIVASVLVILETGFRTERGQAARTHALGELRTAMNRVTKEVRQALSVSASSTQGALDMQTLVNGVQRRIVYDVSDGTLRRAVDGGTPAAVTGGVTTPAVFCYDPPACAQTSPSSANPGMVKVTLSIKPAHSGAAPVSVSQDVRLRNTRS